MMAWFAWCLLLGATDMLNASALSGAPHRIVSLAPAATETLFALGAGNDVVGVTRYDTYPPAVTRRPKVGGLFDPDIEAVLALHPDLIIALPAARERLPHLARAGPAILVAPAQTLDDMWALIAALGRVLRREAEATALAARLRGELARVQSDGAHAHTQPLRVLLIVGHRPWVAAGPGSFLDALLPMAGAVNVVVRGGNYPVLDEEAVLALRPEVVVNLIHGGAGKFPKLAGVRTLDNADEALMLPGPRLPAAVQRLAAQLRATPTRASPTPGPAPQAPVP